LSALWTLDGGVSYFDGGPPRLPVGWPGCAGFFFLGRPFGQPPFLAFNRAAAALAGLVARPACAARTLPMSAPHLGHFSLLILRHYRLFTCARHVRLGRRSGAAGSAGRWFSVWPIQFQPAKGQKSRIC